ncbi:hypothetical protein GCM10010983_13450 [Caulobacter rhizosphaerae]|jgi:hypothetical protein|uniref:hypothetical protein n=1 Tax=Caulobacter rhizosphaerae TaxID=2010972 RepID=UPI0016684E2D|nr:hypothetical protein [Caulobacter rhizosphaerae]GGL17413.1 hypothetical protein GCM10010983_13450 [Caulobacter rhizosphaerae]
MRPRPETVIAQYSLAKVSAWVGGVLGLGACLWAYVAVSVAYGVRERHPSDYAVATGLALIFVTAAGVVALGVALTGGVAIAVVEDTFVFNFLFSRRRVSRDDAKEALAAQYVNDTPFRGGTGYQPPPIILPQLTLRRRGQADLTMRTALMKETAETIAARMNAVIRPTE